MWLKNIWKMLRNDEIIEMNNGNESHNKWHTIMCYNYFNERSIWHG